MVEATNRGDIVITVGSEVCCTEDCLNREIGFSGFGKVLKLEDVGGYIIAKISVNGLVEELHIDWLR